MRTSRCLSKWRQGQPVLGITLHLTDPCLFELTSMLGFDLIWIDLEHHARSVERTGDMIRASRVSSADVIVRPGKGEFIKIGRLLEAGAAGIMYPRCDSPEEAQQVVYNAKFAPLGGRGLDGSGPDALYGTSPLIPYLEHANKETFLVMQIEDRNALSKAADIGKVNGVDMLFFGPGDYSVTEGFPGDFKSHKYWEAVEQVAHAAQASGKMWGTPAFSFDHAKRLLDMGAMLITYSSDLTLLRKRLVEIREEFQPLGFAFK